MDLGSYWDYLEETAASRLRNNRTSRHVYQYGADIELIGAAGELAARRFLGLSTKLHKEFDGGSDLSWRGYRVDVKATKLTPRLNYRYLQWPEGKRLKSDIVLMMAVNVNSREATVCGWAWASQVREAPINYDRDYPCHEIPVVDLHPMWELHILEPKKVA